MSLTGKINWFRSLRLSDRFLAIELILSLGIARLAVLTLPFRWIAPHLGKVGHETSNDPPRKMEKARSIGLGIRFLSSRTPWKSNCLTQAIAGKMMLKRRRIPTTLYLGLSKDGKILQAHAWLRCGEEVLTGDKGRDQYTEVSKFGDET